MCLDVSSIESILHVMTKWRDSCVSNKKVCELRSSSPANDALVAADHGSLDVCRVVAEPSNAESLVQ